MTDPLSKPPARGPHPDVSDGGEPPGPRPPFDDDSLRTLLRRAPADPPELLGGVQRRIRDRSQGRFYRDGWSRSKIATSTYVVTSLLVIGVFLFAYWVLLPSLPVR